MMVAMWWHKLGHTEKPLRTQLLEAHENVSRQIEVLELGPIRGQMDGGAYYDGLKAELLETLKNIDEALAEQEPDNS